MNNGNMDKQSIYTYHTRTILGLLTVIFCVTSVRSSECHSVSNIGREFYIGLPYINESNVIYAYSINILSDTNGTAFVRAPAFHMVNKTYPLMKGHNSVLLDNRQSDPALIKSYAAVLYLVSDVDISVSVFVYGHKYRIADTFLVIPSDALSKEYIISSSRPIRDYLNNQIIIIGTRPNTTVTERGLHYTIGRFDADVIDNDWDESCVKITATEPVAVLSASQAAKVPDYFSSHYGAEPAIEMLLPTGSAGKFFTVPPLPDRDHYLIKIYPLYNNTFVQTWNDSGNTNTGIRYMLEYVLGNGYLNIFADKPILVYQYAFSSGNENPDFKGTFFRSISAHEHFVSSADFVVQNYERSIKNYLQIITDDIHSVYIDGKNISNELGEIIQARRLSGNTMYFTDIFSIAMDALPSKSIHKIRSIGGAKFSAMLTGYASHRQSAYGQQLAIQTTVCSNTSGTATPGLTTSSMTPLTLSFVTTEPSTTTSWTTTKTTSTSRPTSQPSSANLTSTQGYLCLQCDDLTHIYLCNNFVRCSNMQGCVVDKYSNAAGQTRFNVGCRDNRLCNNNDDPANDDARQRRRITCTQCCHGNFCNNKGCGADEFPSGIPRGPMCLNCQHALSVDECNTLSYCHQDEVCSIQVSELLPGLKQLQLGCSSKQCLSSRSIRRRSSTQCEHCCSDDFCNHECKDPAPAIVG